MLQIQLQFLVASLIILCMTKSGVAEKYMRVVHDMESELWWGVQKNEVYFQNICTAQKLPICIVFFSQKTNFSFTGVCDKLASHFVLKKRNEKWS